MMEQVFNILIEKGGLFGALFVGSLLVIIWLNKRNIVLQEKLETVVGALQDKRFEEHKNYIERMFTALGTNTEVTKAAADGFKALTTSNGEIKQELVKLSERVVTKRRAG